MSGDMPDDARRALPRAAAKNLPPGAAHYSAYVGPPGQWDIMGAAQFRLMTALGLRESHKVLDIGCGALRAGRLLMMYLNKGGYFGIEPNNWLIEDAIASEIGSGLIELKAPSFAASSDFAAEAFGVAFDFILAQSIFSHAGPELVDLALQRFKAALAPGGLVLATFIHAAQASQVPQEAPGWTYPGCTSFVPERIAALIAQAGLYGRALPWYHPRQTWYVMAAAAADLPGASMDHHLSGATWRVAEMKASLEIGA